MKLLKIYGFMALLLLLGNFHSVPARATAPAALISQTLDCQHLANLTYTEMNPTQIKVAKNCDQREAAQSWQNAYGKMNHTEMTKATVYEAS